MELIAGAILIVVGPIILLICIAYLYTLYVVGKVICNKLNSDIYKILTVLILIMMIPVPYLMFKRVMHVQEEIEKAKNEHLASIRNQVDEQRKNNLIEACNKEAKIVVNQKIPQGSGIFIDELHKYVSYHSYNSFDSREDHRKLVQSLMQMCTTSGLEAQAGGYYAKQLCSEKYSSSIQWVYRADLRRVTKKFGRVSFIEFFEFTSKYDMPEDWKNQYWDEEKSRISTGIISEGNKDYWPKSVHRSATKAWWIEKRERKLAEAWTEQFIETMHFRNLKDHEFVENPIPVNESLAPYRLTISDISTIQDHNKGIRRGKIVLKDKKTNKILSEYISFDEAPRKGHSDAGYAKWNCLNLNTLADNANGYDVSDIYQFFFSHAVENNEMVENQR